MLQPKSIIKVLIVLMIVIAFLSCTNSMPGDNSVVNGESAPPRYGLIEEDAQTIARVGYYSSYTRGDELPDKVDLSYKMPPVGDQGQQGSCVGWATAYAAKSFQEGLEEEWDLTRTSHQFSPAWLYNSINGGEDGGSQLSDALDLFVSRGCDTLDNFPYYDWDYKRQPDLDSYIRAIQYKADTWYFLHNDVNELKSVLANDNNVIIIGCSVYEDLVDLNPDNPVYDVVSGGLLGGHAMCIVGYDDEKRAFKLINSWGKNDWGIDGYGWISYDFVKDNSLLDIFYACVLIDAENNSAGSLWTDGPLYQSNDSSVYYIGELLDSNSLTLEYSTNSSSIHGSCSMVKEKGFWKADLEIPDDIRFIRFYVEDNNGNIDNNNRYYWIFDVEETYSATLTYKSFDTGTPVSNTWIILYDVQSRRIINSNNTDVSGTVTFSGLKNGSYQAVCDTTNIGYTYYEFDFDINNSDHTSIIELYSLTSPENLRVVKTFSAALTLCWDQVSGATEYEITIDVWRQYYRTINVQYNQSGVTICDLEPGTSNIISVKAIKDGQTGSKSNITQVTNQPLYVAPEGFQVLERSDSLLLNWQPIQGLVEASDIIYEYKIFRSESENVGFNQIGTVYHIPSVSALNYKDTDIEGGITYYYKVRVNKSSSLDPVGWGVLEKGYFTETKSGRRSTLLSNYGNVYFRGTPDNWSSINMTLISDYTWEITKTFGNSSDEKFKFDIYDNWYLNFGDNDLDGIADQNGANIPVYANTKYQIIFNDNNKHYTVNPQPPDNQNPVRLKFAYPYITCYGGGAIPMECFEAVRLEVKIKNIAYDKSVKLVYNTYSGWTERDLIFKAHYGDYDIFTLSNTTITNEFCIKYTADGTTYWDNNGGENYTVGIHYNDIEYGGATGGNIMLNEARAWVNRMQPDTLTGKVYINNISAVKKVVVRYSRDYGDTWYEEPAYYSDQNITNSNNIEIWEFAADHGYVMDEPWIFCVYYEIKDEGPDFGKRYWDNNFGQNYEIFPEHSIE